MAWNLLSAPVCEQGETNMALTAPSAWDLLEALPDATVVTNPEGRIQFINEQALSLFGYPRHELLGQPMEVLLPERFREAHRGHRSGYFGDPKKRRKGTGKGLEIFGRRKDGTEFPAEIVLAPTRLPEGVLVTAAVRDITERKRTEALIRRADLEIRAINADLEQRVKVRTAQLEQTNQFLNAIIENIPDMVCVKDAERLACVRFNKAGEALLGISRTDVLGKNDHDFFPAKQADLRQARERETLRAGVTLDIPEEPLDTKLGRRWLHTRQVPILGEDGSAQFLLGISQDITEAKRSRAALVCAKEAAEAANRELESFSYSVAHDLRAPLRSIDGFSQALLEDHGEKLEADARESLSYIRESAQQMVQLIDGLLGLSRVTRGELRHEEVDLGALARAAVTRLQRCQPERRVDVVIQEGLTVDGDPRLLSVALDNLLGNSWKFTAHCERPRVEFGATSDNGRPTYFVRDNGAGFDMAFVSKLFGVFQRLHAGSEFEGTGVGLATVQRVVSRHGGRVWGRGEVNGGATFSFTLNERERAVRGP